MSWLPKKNVVVPLDMSEFSMTALDTALEMVASPSDILVVHVLRDLSAVDPGVVWGDVDEHSRRAAAEKHIKKQLADQKYQGIQVHVLFGAPANEVARFAQYHDAELIVIHSHGHTGAKHLLIGSVAERIIRQAHCPVLVMRD